MAVKKNYYKPDKTAFSQWLRDKSGMDSYDGYRCYDIDFVWGQKRDDKLVFMFLEEKCKDGLMSYDQFLFNIRITDMIQNGCLYTPQQDWFLGFHFIRFENTTPDNGLMWLDDKLITVPELQKFLQFESDMEIYKSYHHKLLETGINWQERCRR